MGSDRWVIRNVSEEVQRIVRVLAADRNITVAEALEIIVLHYKSCQQNDADKLA